MRLEATLSTKRFWKTERGMKMISKTAVRDTDI